MVLTLVIIVQYIPSTYLSSNWTLVPFNHFPPTNLPPPTLVTINLISKEVFLIKMPTQMGVGQGERGETSRQVTGTQSLGGFFQGGPAGLLRAEGSCEGGGQAGMSSVFSASLLGGDQDQGTGCFVGSSLPGPLVGSLPASPLSFQGRVPCALESVGRMNISERQLGKAVPF